VPAEQFAGVAVHHERQGRPLVAPSLRSRPEAFSSCLSQESHLDRRAAPAAPA
jgi:hypothetical protein